MTSENILWLQAQIVPLLLFLVIAICVWQDQKRRRLIHELIQLNRELVAQVEELTKNLQHTAESRDLLKRMVTYKDVSKTDPYMYERSKRPPFQR